MPEWLLSACFFLGLLLVALGVALVSPPAGVVVAGVELVAVSVAYSRSGDEP